MHAHTYISCVHIIYKYNKAFEKELFNINLFISLSVKNLFHKTLLNPQ